MSTRPSAGQFLDDMVPERPITTDPSPAATSEPTTEASDEPQPEPKRPKKVTTKSKRRERPGGPAQPAAKKPATKDKLTITVPIEFAEELRNAVVWLQQNGQRETLTSLIVESTRARFTELRDEIGGPIPERDEQWSRLVPGAPPGSPSTDT